MPQRTAVSSLIGWKCAQCRLRSFSSSSALLAVGPEHPQYIPVPQPPQQDVPRRPPVKGILPVPRDVFAGTDRSKTDDQLITESTPLPKTPRTPVKGSREEWNTKMSYLRRQNLSEGVRSLRARQESEMKRLRTRSIAKQNEREELLNRPEREDERLTAPSNDLDLDTLFNKAIPDPSREQRIVRKMQNVRRHEEKNRRERMENLHTLYLNARDFIVTSKQLDKAVDIAFGTPESPKTFGSSMALEDGYNSTAGKSIWAEGRPERVQDMLNRATGQRARTALESAGGHTEINQDRIRRIAETLTGGKMEKETR